MKGRIAELNTALFTANQLAQLVNIPVIPAGKGITHEHLHEYAAILLDKGQVAVALKALLC